MRRVDEYCQVGLWWLKLQDFGVNLRFAGPHLNRIVAGEPFLLILITEDNERSTVLVEGDWSRNRIHRDCFRELNSKVVIQRHSFGGDFFLNIHTNSSLRESRHHLVSLRLVRLPRDEWKTLACFARQVAPSSFFFNFSIEPIEALLVPEFKNTSRISNWIDIFGNGLKSFYPFRFPSCK